MSRNLKYAANIPDIGMNFMPSNLSIVVTLLHRAPVLLACSKLSLLYNITIFGYKLAPLLACANEYPLSFKLFSLLDEVDIEQTRGGSKPLRSNPRSMRGSLGQVLISGSSTVDTSLAVTTFCVMAVAADSENQSWETQH